MGGARYERYAYRHNADGGRFPGQTGAQEACVRLKLWTRLDHL
jgi:hypothetical protein